MNVRVLRDGVTRFLVSVMGSRRGMGILCRGYGGLGGFYEGDTILIFILDCFHERPC